MINLTCTKTPASSKKDLWRVTAKVFASFVPVLQAAVHAWEYSVIIVLNCRKANRDRETFPVPEIEAGRPISAYEVSKLVIEVALKSDL